MDTKPDTFTETVSLSGFESGPMTAAKPEQKEASPSSSLSMNQILGQLGGAALSRSLGFTTHNFASSDTSGSTWGSVVNRQFAALQPWSDFFRPSRFGIPRNPKVVVTRLLKNSEKFLSNYLCVSLVLVFYCILTSPLLLLALVAIAGAGYIISVRNAQKPLVVLGRQLSMREQLLGLGVASIPLLWLVGVSQVIFWIIGASVVTVVLHATLYKSQQELEEEQLMEYPSLQSV